MVVVVVVVMMVKVVVVMMVVVVVVVVVMMMVVVLSPVSKERSAKHQKANSTKCLPHSCITRYRTCFRYNCCLQEDFKPR